MKNDMKKIAFILSIGLMTSSYGQEAHSHYGPVNHSECGNNLEQEAAYKKNPQLKIQDDIDQQLFEEQYQDYLASYDPFARSAYVIPVVVHVVHLGGVDNISDEQILDGIEKLNEDYNMANTDLSAVVAGFTGVIGNVDVEFRLATKDNNGNCHSGITRTFSQYTVDDGSGDLRGAVLNEHGNWPQNKYMNVFVCQDPNGAAGYTNYPSNSYSPTGMGGSIYLRHDYCGTIGTGDASRRRTWSHECGHWLNLRHVWGSNNSAGDAASCSTDDDVTDTPNTIGNSSCNTSTVSCSSLDNVQNNMDYTGSCRRMFTQGQAARMQTALNNSIAERNNLWTASNLSATGVDGPGDLCEIIFSSNIQYICEGGSVDFYDESYHNITSRTWTFTGGTPAMSSDANPTITYNTTGVYSVSLEGSDGSSTQSDTKTNYIVVLPNTGDALPYFEGFEGLSTIPDNDRFVVQDLSGVDPWQLSTSAGAESSSQSAFLNNFGNSDLSIDELLSGTIDLSAVDAADAMVFNFKYAYRKRDSGNDEWLRFYISKDCGDTWALRKVIHGADLSSITSTSSYTPQPGAEWYHVDVTNITSEYYVSNFRYKFQFENDNGNNIYLDNINLYPSSMTSLVEEHQEIGVSLYPNPAKDKTDLVVSGLTGENFKIVLYSALGQEISLLYSGDIIEGANKYEINTTSLSEGFYIVRIENEDFQETIKLIKR